MNFYCISKQIILNIFQNQSVIKLQSCPLPLPLPILLQIQQIQPRQYIQYNINKKPLQISNSKEKTWMSVETYTPIHNDVRYNVKLTYHRQNNNVIYDMEIYDLALGKQDLHVFRFSEVKKYHQFLTKNLKTVKQRIPEFPKTHSFAFWNKTNNCPHKLEERRRELEFYFTKLINDPIIRSSKEIKNFLKSAEKARRTKSMNSVNSVSQQSYNKSKDKGKSKQKQRVNSLPKVSLHRTHSIKEQTYLSH